MIAEYLIQKTHGCCCCFKKSYSLVGGEDAPLLRSPTEARPIIRKFQDKFEKSKYNCFHAFFLLYLMLNAAADGLFYEMRPYLFTTFEKELKTNEAINSTIFSAMSIGLAITALVCGAMSDRVGRWPMYLVGFTGILVFGTLTAFSQSWPVLLVLHFIVGLFQGMQKPVRYSLSAEFFPLKGRGAVMMLTRIGWPIGALCATLFQRFVHPFNLPQLGMFGQGWRLCLILSCFPLYILLLIGLIWVPESPRYYIAMGKYKKAFSVLSDMRGCSCRKDRQKIIDEDKKDLELLLAIQHDKQQPLGDMHRPKKLRRRSKLSRACNRCFPRELWTVPRLSYTSIMIAVAFALVNFSAVSIRAFNPTLLEKYKAIGKPEITKIIGFGQVCDMMGILIGALLTERVGRKPLVIWGFLAAGIGTFVVPFTKNATYLMAAIGFQQLAQAWVYLSMMVYAAEALPTVVRSAAIGFGLATSRVFAAIALPVNGYLLQVFGDKMYILLAAVYTFGSVLCLLLLPKDTKGKLLNDRVRTRDLL